MKLSKAKIQECSEWVERNGLYPQPCGAAVKQFCPECSMEIVLQRKGTLTVNNRN